MAVNYECNNVQHIFLNVTGTLHHIMQYYQISILGKKIKFLSNYLQGEEREREKSNIKTCAFKNTM